MSGQRSEVPLIHDRLVGAPTNWGKWGDDDEVGGLNYLDVGEVLRGIGSVVQGKVFTLQAQMGHPHGDLMAPTRKPGQKFMYLDEGSWAGDKGPKIPGGAHYADDYIMTFLQASTQYDALGHFWYDGEIYNGYDAKTTIGGLSKASVLPIAERGVVGHGVLIDMARYRGQEYLSPDEAFTHQDILDAAQQQGTVIEKRDILLIRTGAFERFFAVPAAEFYADFQEPGLVYSSELVTWFQEMEVPNLVTDTVGNEISKDPSTGAEGTLHCALMRNLGVVFTEICNLGGLAEDCAVDGQWDFLYAAAPLKVVGGTGSPVNPIVVK